MTPELVFRLLEAAISMPSRRCCSQPTTRGWSPTRGSCTGVPRVRSGHGSSSWSPGRRCRRRGRSRWTQHPDEHSRRRLGIRHSGRRGARSGHRRRCWSQTPRAPARSGCDERNVVVPVQRGRRAVGDRPRLVALRPALGRARPAKRAGAVGAARIPLRRHEQRPAGRSLWGRRRGGARRTVAGTE